MQRDRRAGGRELRPVRRLEAQRQADDVAIELDRALHVADENDGVAEAHANHLSCVQYAKSNQLAADPSMTDFASRLIRMYTSVVFWGWDRSCRFWPRLANTLQRKSTARIPAPGSAQRTVQPTTLPRVQRVVQRPRVRSVTTRASRSLGKTTVRRAELKRGTAWR